jgi:hypothetical protein
LGQRKYCGNGMFDVKSTEVKV